MLVFFLVKGSYMFEDMLGLKSHAILGNHLYNLILVSSVEIRNFKFFECLCIRNKICKDVK